MAHGLEVRVPMLGQPVLDAVMTLPASAHLDGGSKVAAHRSGETAPAGNGVEPREAWFSVPLQPLFRRCLEHGLQRGHRPHSWHRTSRNNAAYNPCGRAPGPERFREGWPIRWWCCCCGLTDQRESKHDRLPKIRLPRQWATLWDDSGLRGVRHAATERHHGPEAPAAPAAGGAGHAPCLADAQFSAAAGCHLGHGSRWRRCRCCGACRPSFKKRIAGRRAVSVAGPCSPPGPCAATERNYRAAETGLLAGFALTLAIGFAGAVRSGSLATADWYGIAHGIGQFTTLLAMMLPLVLAFCVVALAERRWLALVAGLMLIAPCASALYAMPNRMFWLVARSAAASSSLPCGPALSCQPPVRRLLGAFALFGAALVGTFYAVARTCRPAI